MSARAIVLAAGKGTRMKSAWPKVLHELCGRPMLWWVLEALHGSGVQEIAVVTNAELDPFVSRFGVRTVVQSEQLGTGHAVKTALDALEPRDGSVLVAYGDMPLVDAAIFRDVQSALRRSKATALAMVTARMPLPSSFGRVMRAAEKRGTSAAAVERIVEAKDCTPEQLAVDEMNAGIYAFEEPALREAVARIGNSNAQAEYYLTDAVELLIAAGRRVAAVTAGDYRSVLGVNDRVELAAARALLNARLCEAHMRAGVTIVDPATTYLDPGLQIACDVTIHPGTWIFGETKIGEGTSIGPHCRIGNSVLGERCDVRESVILSTRIGDDVRVGPFAHLRDGNVIGDRVRIGNFVEFKKSEIGDDVKANHLAYIGDASVGARTNFAAGSITCNYDGERKHRTEIGADVFIGTNNALVAPLTIGDGAATGAGSVVIRDVAPGERVAGVPAKPLPSKTAPR
ncbi:MAG TPA: bifunctional UDP-N-acetylglucosamine diphosphorylase/glucosamine-1-phosphate N-acetyltransferase GlmU [Candidatus Elarobacter sp.]|jgi:bifunctional UDP-N-acetylglucosamine pyrophosphorylase/glucosamine-1-phosphate N-acetyltransferase|nr:bifunctional UDP-N-acetylglucosamine diphosphorylase/glucosamine-1-phosphate N-acetyltransferase GlmU [Candidatus Elarobacter sp.]